MARHFLQHFLLALPALWLVFSFVFLLIHLGPGDPVGQMLGEGAAPGQVIEMRDRQGLDRPLLVQYAHDLQNILRGDFGESFKFQRPVRHFIFERYPATLQLALPAGVVRAVLAIPAEYSPPQPDARTPCRRVGYPDDR